MALLQSAQSLSVSESFVLVSFRNRFLFGGGGSVEGPGMLAESCCLFSIAAEAVVLLQRLFSIAAEAVAEAVACVVVVPCEGTPDLSPALLGRASFLYSSLSPMMD